MDDQDDDSLTVREYLLLALLAAIVLRIFM
jgi:hypothetical protein